MHHPIEPRGIRLALSIVLDIRTEPRPVRADHGLAKCGAIATHGELVREESVVELRRVG